jgi:hypothetical protein
VCSVMASYSETVEINSQSVLDKELKLKNLKDKYSHIIIRLTELNGDSELFQIRSGWLFLESKSDELWCYYPNCYNSYKYVEKYPFPNLTDVNANFHRYKCHRWPQIEDCFHGKKHYFFINQSTFLNNKIFESKLCVCVCKFKT